MANLEYVRAYIHDLLITTKATYLEHRQRLATVLTSWFAQEELEYLGYWITRNGIQPTQEYVAMIQNISAPAKEKELSRFIGMINYYCDMWIR
jgi:hypothetical protein